MNNPKHNRTSVFPHDTAALGLPKSRRDFLCESGSGLGGIALASLLGTQNAVATGKASFKRPKAKRIVQLFMGGAASHLDTFDYKPALIKHNGVESDFGEHVEAFQNGLGPWMQSPWEFQRYGKSGKHLSEVVAPLGDCVDDMAFIHNLEGKTGVHSQATYLQATGFQRPGYPGMGAWISYGLGSLNENLPTFVVMPDHRGFASNGPKNWGAAFLPAEHQGTIVQPGRDAPITDLRANAEFITDGSNTDAINLINRLNRRHNKNHLGDSRLDARIKSYELAARMQLAAPEALDLSKESTSIKELYGIKEHVTKWPTLINAEEEVHHFGLKCLTARRLLERGVRFIQIWSGNDNSFPRRNWDSHEDIERDHGPLSYGMAKGSAALIKDLKQRGMLEDTIILWTTEFGRMPSSQGSKGRDHNPYCFSNWLCGGGIKGGVTHGESDQWGYKPLDRANPTQVYDIHATMLHLLGVDHRALTVRHNGIDRRLTDVHGHVINQLLA
jgi:hypothetical protein